jgi:hypothetical protein
MEYNPSEFVEKKVVKPGTSMQGKVTENGIRQAQMLSALK